MNPIIIIPSRLNASRLPNKPLLKIKGKPMIEHVWLNGLKSSYRVVVATGDKDIFDHIISIGGEAVMTHPELPTGSDRCAEAVDIVDPSKEHDVVINLQGDLPVFDGELLRSLCDNLEFFDKEDVSTFGTDLTPDEYDNPNVVKVYTNEHGSVITYSRELLDLPINPFYINKHIGVYGYRREALEKFSKLPQSDMERKYKLEQLRSTDLVHGLVDFGGTVEEVNTKEDLIKVNLRD